MRRLRPLIIGVGLTACFFERGVLATDQANCDCDPTYKVLTEERETVQLSSLWQLGFKAVLIGCSADLQALSESERQVMIAQLRTIAKENDLEFYQDGMEGTSEFRDWLAAALNSVVGRRVVSDVFFDELGVAEHLPS